MILVVGGTKGGSGKTLLAGNLAVLRAGTEHATLLIDADEQASAMDFTRHRQQRLHGEPGYPAMHTREADVTVQVRHLTAKYAAIIIDVGGRDTASQGATLAVAHVPLMPFAPTSVDLWAVETVAQLLQEAQVFNPPLRAYTMLNKAFPRGSDNADAAALLRESPDVWTYLDTPLGLRKAFSNAFGGGYAVTEYPPKDTKAIADMLALYQHVLHMNMVLS